MKRIYTASYYREMLARCRETVPGVAVSSDFIVGFCGETEESFAKSMDLVRDAKFKNSFIFKYSERPGTKAADRYPDDVPEEVKKRRNNDLLAMQNANSLADHRAQVGNVGRGAGRRPEPAAKRMDEPGRRPRSPVKQLTGRTMTDHIVVFDGTNRLIGQTVRVAITDASPFTLYGTVETDEVIGANTDTERGKAYRLSSPRGVGERTDKNRISLPLA